MLRRGVRVVEDVVVGVGGVIGVVAHGVSDGREPVCVPAVKVAVTAGASLEQLMLVLEAEGVRGDTTEEVGTDKDRVIGRNRCRVGKRDHAE
jgi:hypothetical protein